MHGCPDREAVIALLLQRHRAISCCIGPPTSRRGLMRAKHNARRWALERIFGLMTLWQHPARYYEQRFDCSVQNQKAFFPELYLEMAALFFDVQG